MRNAVKRSGRVIANIGNVAILGTALLAIQIPPAFAANDVALAHRFVVAQYEFTRLIAVNLTRGLDSMDALVHDVKRECSDVASEAPPSVLSQAQKIVQEMGGTLLVTLLHNDRYAIRRFVRSVTHLHWSRSKLTKLVKSEAIKLEKLGNIAIPDLCEDVREWTTSRFAVLPISTLQFDHQLTAIESGFQSSGLKIMQTYENSRTRSLVHRIHVLQKRFDRHESKHALRALFALVRSAFGEKCTPGRLCLPFQTLTPSDLEHGRIGKQPAILRKTQAKSPQRWSLSAVRATRGDGGSACWKSCRQRVEL